MANILANRHPGDAERPGNRCLAQFCGLLEQLFLSFDRLESGRPLPVDSRTERLEQCGLRRRWETGLQLNRLGLVDQRAAAANRFYRFRQILASRLNGGGSRGISSVRTGASRVALACDVTPYESVAGMNPDARSH